MICSRSKNVSRSAEFPSDGATMDLALFSVQNYKRFADQSFVKTPGKLVAFVGPNEAGKSSILQALQHVNNDNTFDRREHPRRSSKSPFLQWTFDLTTSEINGGPKNPEIKSPVYKRLVVKKDATGRSFSLRPFAAEPNINLDDLLRRISAEISSFS